MRYPSSAAEASVPVKRYAIGRPQMLRMRGRVSRAGACENAEQSHERDISRARPNDSDWIGWLKRELARHAQNPDGILVGGSVLCVIISMALQVPELSVTAYMCFFVSKETKHLTTLTGLLGFIGATIGIAGTLLLYKFTYGHPELRIPGMAIALFLGMYLSRVFVLGPLGFSSALLLRSRSRSEKPFPHLNSWFEDFFGSGWPSFTAPR